MYKQRIFSAFTLAEVLITLGIIGVVASMTIPNLVANYKTTQYLTKLKKVYSTMSEAVKLELASTGVSNVTATSLLSMESGETVEASNVEIGDFLKKYFKIARDCGTVFTGHYTSECFASSYKNMNGTTINPVESDANGYSVITADGTSIAMGIYPPMNIVNVSVDINGYKPPNVAGRDLFSFSIYYDSSIDDGIPPNARLTNIVKTQREDRFNTYCVAGEYGAGCLGKILNDGWKMDY